MVESWEEWQNPSGRCLTPELSGGPQYTEVGRRQVPAWSKLHNGVYRPLERYVRFSKIIVKAQWFHMAYVGLEVREDGDEPIEEEFPQWHRPTRV